MEVCHVMWKLHTYAKICNVCVNKDIVQAHCCIEVLVMQVLERNCSWLIDKQCPGRFYLEIKTSLEAAVVKQIEMDYTRQ